MKLEQANAHSHSQRHRDHCGSWAVGEWLEVLCRGLRGLAMEILGTASGSFCELSYHHPSVMSPFLTSGHWLLPCSHWFKFSVLIAYRVWTVWKRATQCFLFAIKRGLFRNSTSLLPPFFSPPFSGENDPENMSQPSTGMSLRILYWLPIQARNCCYLFLMALSSESPPSQVIHTHTCSIDCRDHMSRSAHGTDGVRAITVPDCELGERWGRFVPSLD